MPIIIRDFELSLGAGRIPAVLVLSSRTASSRYRPACWSRVRGPRTTLLAAFAPQSARHPARLPPLPGYLVVIGGLFVIGLGMAMLQVVINPLMRTAGGEAHFAVLLGYGSARVRARLIRESAGLLRAHANVAGIADSAFASLGARSAFAMALSTGLRGVFVLAIVITRALPHSARRAQGRRAGRDARGVLAAAGRPARASVLSGHRRVRGHRADPGQLDVAVPEHLSRPVADAWKARTPSLGSGD